jgi:photosystem II stability/assembly factor-like uncharacterized protein
MKMNPRLLCVFLFALQLAPLQRPLYSQTRWEPLGPYGGTVTFLHTDGKDWVYAGIRGSGVFRSIDAGRKWEPINNGLPGREVMAFCAAPDGRIFCGGENLLAVSTDHGNQWTLLPIGLSSGMYVTNLLVLPDSQIIVSFWENNTVMRSKDNGKTWMSVVPSTTMGGTISTLVRGPGTTVIIGTGGSGVYRFDMQTDAVTLLNYDLPKATAGATPYESCTGIAVKGDGSILASFYGTLYSFNPQMKHWTKYPDYFRSFNFYQGSDSLVYGYNFAIIVMSADFGKTWSTVPVPWEIVDAQFFVKVNGSIMLSEGTGFWRSDDNSKTWNAADQGIVRTDINCGLVSSMNSVIVGTANGGIFRSTDGGTTWANILFPPPGGYGDNVIAVRKNSKNTLFAASKGPAMTVWRSLTDGASWTQTSFKDSSLGMGEYFVITDIFMDVQDILYVSGYAISNDALSGVFRSMNDGNTWTRVFSVPTKSAARSFLLIGENLVLMGTYAKGFYRSTDRGSTWSAIAGTDGLTQINSIVQDSASIVLAATAGSGIMRSADMGLSWKPSNAGLTDLAVRTVSRLSNGLLFAGTEKGGFVSQDHGLSWTSVTSGGPFRSAGSVFADANGTVYVATEAGLFKTVSLVPTSIHPVNESIARPDFSLAQNYPNPFNPSTTISFYLKSRTFVSLKIFDIMGREVASIISQELSAGNHTRNWNAEGLPSGAYFYRLQAGSFTESKRLSLLR